MAYLRQVLSELHQILQHNEELKAQVSEKQDEIEGLKNALQELKNNYEDEIKGIKKSVQELTNDYVRTREQDAYNQDTIARLQSIIQQTNEELIATKEALRVAQRAVEREQARAQRAVEREKALAQRTMEREKALAQCERSPAPAPAPAPAQVDDGVESAMRDALHKRELEEIIQDLRKCPVQ